MDATIIIVEIKSSVADFRAETKWREYPAPIATFYYAIPASMPVDIIPDDAGLILADAYAADILRGAPEVRIAPATRRAMLTRFAHTVAQHLHRLNDFGVRGSEQMTHFSAWWNQ